MRWKKSAGVAGRERRVAKTDNSCGDVEGDGRWRWKANERAILGMGKKVRGGGREGKKAQEALRKKKRSNEQER